jgi:D-glycero-D-manno-heptose 1,7-bisphosphate phosphatase
LLFEIKRFGIRRVVLLASFLSDAVTTFVAEQTRGPLADLDLTIHIEPERAGTGGAIWHARHLIEDDFFLFNGDSWFDINILDLARYAEGSPSSLGCLALREVPDGSRYGAVKLNGSRVECFGFAAPKREPALVNAGIYAMRRELITHLTPNCSLEQDILPRLATSGALLGVRYDGFFIDIGIPSAFRDAQALVSAHQRRSAVFLDRDGVLNEDCGYVGTRERFIWRSGAVAMVKRFNDAGYFVFVVTNQAGVAKGKYSEADVLDLHVFMRQDLAKAGAHIDDIRYCPYHEEGTVAAYTFRSDWRKPEPGMLLDLMRHWPVKRETSVLLGDKDTDLIAAERAGISGFKVDVGTDVDLLAQMIIRSASSPADTTGC